MLYYSVSVYRERVLYRAKLDPASLHKNVLNTDKCCSLINLGLTVSQKLQYFKQRSTYGEVFHYFLYMWTLWIIFHINFLFLIKRIFKPILIFTLEKKSPLKKILSCNIDEKKMYVYGYKSSAKFVHSLIFKNSIGVWSVHFRQSIFIFGIIMKNTIKRCTLVLKIV